MTLRALSLAFPLVALLTGCAGGRDAASTQIAELRAEIVKLRAEHAALAERIDNVELGRSTLAKQPAAPGAPDAVSAPKPEGDRPAMDVVRLSPSEGDGDADSDAPRPLIRAVGPGGVVQERSKDKAAPPAKKPDKPGAPKKAGTNKP